MQESRTERHHRLASKLARIEDAALQELLKAAEVQTGWGANRKFVLDGSGVFAKSIPLTKLEHAHPNCTRNLFELPTFYQYGVGSGGFGAFRELAAHVKTTGWVLSGAVEHFPLMYHHRVLPRLSPARIADADQLDQYVSYWNGSEAVREYVTARESAEHELVVFIELVEQNLAEWMVDHVEQFERVLPPLLEAVRFLRERGVVHFDAHAGNILVDDDRVFLTDFGLVLDRDFELSDKERAMIDSHRYYDEGEVLGCLAQVLRPIAKAWDDETRQALGVRYGDTDPFTLLSHLEELVADGHVDLPESFLEMLLRHRDPILLMGRFFRAMRQIPTKDAVYCDADLGALLNRRVDDPP